MEERRGFHRWENGISRKSPKLAGGGHGRLLQCSFLENTTGRDGGTLGGFSPQGCRVGHDRAMKQQQQQHLRWGLGNLALSRQEGCSSHGRSLGALVKTDTDASVTQ